MINLKVSLRMAIVAALGIATTQSALAQDPGTMTPRQAPGGNPRRAELENRLRQRTGEIVQRRLGLTEEQMTKLQAANKDFEKQRMDLMTRERTTRQMLRAQIMMGDSASQARVSQLLDQSIQIQRQRIDLIQSEQRELGKFLNPVQRAKYLGLQAEMRQRAQQMRGPQMQRRMGGPGEGQMQPPMRGQMKRRMLQPMPPTSRK
ncbi:MAG TPA: hypothetical protein VM053_10965 [Gemmatimonadaceae bacterium]|nr:hypothetical protein [Gemmatimonadaceae bacterium]